MLHVLPHCGNLWCWEAPFVGKLAKETLAWGEPTDFCHFKLLHSVPGQWDPETLAHVKTQPRVFQKLTESTGSEILSCPHQHLLPCLWSQHHPSSYPHDLSALPYFWHLGHCVSKALLLTPKSLSLGCTPSYQNLPIAPSHPRDLVSLVQGAQSVFQPCPIASFHSVMCVENIHWPVARPFCSICFLFTQQPKKLIISASNVHIPNGLLTRSFSPFAEQSWWTYLMHSPVCFAKHLLINQYG